VDVWYECWPGERADAQLCCVRVIDSQDTELALSTRGAPFNFLTDESLDRARSHTEAICQVPRQDGYLRVTYVSHARMQQPIQIAVLNRVTIDQ